MGADKWEVVGPKKGAQNKAGGKTAARKSEGIDGKPAAKALETSSTFAHLDEDNHKPKPTSATKAVVATPAVKEKPTQKKTKPVKEAPKEKPKVPVRTACANISVDEIKSTVSVAKTQFPGRDEVVLSKVAEYLESVLGNSVLDWTTWEKISSVDERREYPLSFLSKNVTSTLRAVINSTPPAKLKSFILYMIRAVAGAVSMSSDKKAVYSTAFVGSRMLLQLAIRTHPEALMRWKDVHDALTQGATIRPHLLPTLNWLALQVIDENPLVGLSMWVGGMMGPATSANGGAGGAAAGSMCMDYLVTILSGKRSMRLMDCKGRAGNAAKECGMQFKHFETLLKLRHSLAGKGTAFGSPRYFSETLAPIFPAIEECSVYLTPAMPREYFPNLMAFLDPAAETSQAMRAHVAGLIAECLTRDSYTVTMFKDGYSKRAAQSLQVLKAVTLSKDMARELKPLIDYCTEVNKTLALKQAANGKGDTTVGEALRDLQDVCEKIEFSSNSSQVGGGCLWSLFSSLFMVIVVAIAVFAAVEVSSLPQGSTTDDIVAHLKARAHEIAEIASEKGPIYAEKALADVKFYSAIAMEEGKRLSVIAHEKGTELMKLAQEKLEEMQKK